MAVVVPFKGVLYNLEKIDDFSKVTAPPYDIISPEQQERYYKNSPHNVIRLILGKQSPDDSNSDNRYTRTRITGTPVPPIFSINGRRNPF